MSQYKLEILEGYKGRVRVINSNGDAELGNWHIADFAWKEHAQFFIDAWNLINTTKGSVGS